VLSVFFMDNIFGFYMRTKHTFHVYDHHTEENNAYSSSSGRFTREISKFIILT